jgi:hypothetical protein
MRDEKKEGEGEGAGNEGDVRTQSGEDVLGFGQRDYMSQTASSARQTTTSTVHEEGFSLSSLINRFRSDDADEDNNSESGFSQTTYATFSGSTKESHKLRVPPPPNNYDGETFECPYCSRIVNDISDSNAWQ